MGLFDRAAMTTSRNPTPAGVNDELGQRVTAREASRVLLAEQLDALRAMAQTMTDFAERFQGRLANHVLEVATVTFDASAQYARQWHAAAGVVEVTNLSGANTITVHAAGASSTAPGTGVGVYRVPPNSTRKVAVASRQVTFYGTAADTFCFQAFTAVPVPVI